jgi:hypothetical protein
MHLNRRINKINHIYRQLFVTRLYLYVSASRKLSKPMVFCLEVYRSTSIQYTYFATPTVKIWVYKTWTIFCLCKQSLSPSVVTKLLLRHTSVFLLLMRFNHPQYTDRVCRGSPSTCTSFFDILLFNVTKWTTVGHSEPRGLKTSQTSPVVWGRHSSRRRRTLTHTRWTNMYGQVNQSSGKHQRYAGWEGHYAYCRLRLWKFSYSVNE